MRERDGCAIGPDTSAFDEAESLVFGPSAACVGSQRSRSRSSAGPELHICARVGTYRRFARALVRETDTVIELGAAEGHTTYHLARGAAEVVAVEKVEQNIKRARERCRSLENIIWLKLDAFEAGEVAKVMSEADVVFIDIGGSTWPSIVLRAAAIYRHLFRPRAMVIRSVELNDFAAAVTSCESDAKPGHWRKP